MMTFDFSPLFRSTVGFDRMMALLDSATRVDESNLSYPPYNIEKTGENAYRITMAVAGFGEDDIEIVLKDDALVVRGKLDRENGDVAYLHRGIAGRSFERRFEIAEFVAVTGANLVDGLLHIELKREVPEELKPRRIAITAGAPKTLSAKAKKLIDTKKKAA